MHELRLLFTPGASDSFHLTLTDAAGAEVGVACDFTPFLTDTDYEDLRWYLEECCNILLSLDERPSERVEIIVGALERSENELLK
jgi:hypothetical protein